MLDEDVCAYLLAWVKSPKSDAFPSVAIVAYSIVFVFDGDEYNNAKRKDTLGGSARIDTISLAIDYGTFQTCNHWYNAYNWMGRLASANGGKCSVIK